MRVFRSKKPDGPYLDPGNRNAIFTSYSLNFGPKAPARGQKLLGPYSHWGFMPQGERSQGHNSIIAAPDGRTYLVYHTRFCNDEQRPDEGHQVRVHQVLLSKNGWLLAAPFEYNGESITDADIATQQLLTSEQVAGTYEVLLHKFANDHQNLEQVTPIVITLDADGKVSGDKTGTWSLEAGTGYINLTLSALKYEGVVLEETMDEQNLHAVAITATNTQGVGLWAYKKHPKYAVAWQLNHQTVPVKDGQTVNHNVDLYSILVDGEPNVSAEWVSSHPDIISNTGRYNPAGLQENTNVTLTARIASANYYWQQDYTVRALSEQNSQPLVDGWQEGIVAHYGFDDGSLANTFNADEMAQFLRKGATKAPSLYDDDPLRNGGYVRLSAGGNKKESYVAIPNPLYGKELADGATLAFWVRRTDANLWDALCGFEGGDAHLYTTGNLYTGYNDGHGNWIDINHPETVATTNLTVGHWHQLTISYSRQASRGITMYVDGVAHSNDRINGEQGGKKVSTKSAFDYNAIVDLIASSPMLYLGNGSFWGSPDASFDDVIVYDRAFTRSTEATALYQMMDRVFSFASLTNGIGATLMNNDEIIKDVYDLQGRKVLPTALKKGIYIINGKKTVKL